MIISYDINPKKQLYYIGSLILERFSSNKIKELDFFELYFEFKKNYKIPMNLFAFALDWLFIIGAIKIEGEKIIKCL